MIKRRITAGEISVGSVLPWDVYDEDGRLLLAKGHAIVSSNQIDALIKRGLFVTADTKQDKGKASPRKQARLTAATLILDVRSRLQGICAPSAQKEIFPEQVMHLRQLIADACRQNQNVALAMILREQDGRYSIRHAVDTAVICHVVGGAMGITEAELTAIVSAALTMNISMLELQDDLQSNRLPLTSEQREIIAHHPRQSVAMLQERGITDSLWIDAVLNHHEGVDGSGYPSHKKGGEIPFLAQLLSMADIYCARVSGRDYRPSLRPNTALRALFLNQGVTMDQELTGRFVKATGIYPSGTPVRLDNGEIAIVIGQGEKANTPLVSSLIGPGDTRYTVPIQRDTSQPNYTVRDVVEWSKAGPFPGLGVLWGKEGVVS